MEKKIIKRFEQKQGNFQLFNPVFHYIIRGLSVGQRDCTDVLGFRSISEMRFG